MGRSVAAGTAALVLAGGLGAPSGAYQRPGRNELLTVRKVAAPLPVVRAVSARICEDRVAGDAGDITPDGRFVVFASVRNDLVPGDTNNACDIFRLDRKTGTTIRVSVSSSGEETRLPSIAPAGTATLLHPDSLAPSISDNGRYVAFSSWAMDLVEGDSNSSWDIFLHDARSRKTNRISVSATGGEGNGRSRSPSISSSGRFVAFETEATNLTRDGSEEYNRNVLVKDRRANKIIAVALGRNNIDGARGPAISGDGRFVAYARGVNLNSDDDHPLWIADVKRDKSIPVGPRENRSAPFFPNAGGVDISGSGRHVAFSSGSKGWVPNDAFPAASLSQLHQYVYDAATGRIERVSVNAFGEVHSDANDQMGYESKISPDGRYALFSSSYSFYAPQEGDPGYDPTFGGPGDEDTYVHDRASGSVMWASPDKDGGDGEGCSASDDERKDSRGAALSNKARHVLFYGNGSCLAEGVEQHDQRDFLDFFLRDMGPEVGIGAVENSGPTQQEPPDDQICVTPDLCVPPGAAVFTPDDTDDLGEPLTEQGANLYGASLAYRPQYSDLFVKIELEHMPRVIPGASPIFYGLSFKAGGKSYEARATSLDYGTFGLFDVTHSKVGTKVADLRGGYGTTGMRVVFSLPLDEVGLGDGGQLSDVEAFSALGNFLSSAATMLDFVRLK